MGLHRAVAVLRKEKELLNEVLDLAACQFELVESNRIEDLEVLLSLMTKPMDELSNLESAFGGDMMPVEGDLTPAELNEIEELNMEIIILSNQITEIDERTERLAEQYDSSYSAATTRSWLSRS